MSKWYLVTSEDAVFQNTAIENYLEFKRESKWHIAHLSKSRAFDIT